MADPNTYDQTSSNHSEETITKKKEKSKRFRPCHGAWRWRQRSPSADSVHNCTTHDDHCSSNSSQLRLVSDVRDIRGQNVVHSDGVRRLASRVFYPIQSVNQNYRRPLAATASGTSTFGSCQPTSHLSASIWFPCLFSNANVSSDDEEDGVSSERGGISSQHMESVCHEMRSQLCLMEFRHNHLHNRQQQTHARSNVDALMAAPYPVHTQVEYTHYLVPDLQHIFYATYYWHIMDRFEAEKLLENRPEGTFLLRDSAQQEYLFSVSFRRYGRTLHARIEQQNHKFSFDAYDPGLYASDTVTGLIEHYKDPAVCLFFEPQLSHPLHRNMVFSLQSLSRAVICEHITYNDIQRLQLPNKLKDYLRHYHYRQAVRTTKLE